MFACAVRILTVAGFSLLAGCITPETILNDDFLAALGVADTAADLPGEAPAVLVRVENATARTIETLVTWRDDEGNASTRIWVLEPFGSRGESVICPMAEITLGDVGNLNATGAVVRLGNGLATDPVVEVEPFGVLLQEEINYDCGDSVTFSIQTSSATLSGYQTFAFVSRAEADETP